MNLCFSLCLPLSPLVGLFVFCLLCRALPVFGSLVVFVLSSCLYLLSLCPSLPFLLFSIGYLFLTFHTYLQCNLISISSLPPHPAPYSSFPPSYPFVFVYLFNLFCDSLSTSLEAKGCRVQKSAIVPVPLALNFLSSSWTFLELWFRDWGVSRSVSFRTKPWTVISLAVRTNQLGVCGDRCPLQMEGSLAKAEGRTDLWVGT